MDHVALRSQIAEEERAVRGFPLDDAALFALANRLIAASPAPLAVKIVLGRRTVVEMSPAATAGDNAAFLERKINTVFNTGHSSLWWFHNLRATGRSLADVLWADPREVIDFGGAVGLYAGEALVGAVAVSGLPHEDDHKLIIAQMLAAL